MQCDKMFFCLNFMTVFVIFLCHSGLTQHVDLPPLEFPSVNNNQRSETPPHVFPENDPNYKIIKNITILKDLRTHAANKDQNQTKIDTEVPDLVASALDAENSTSQTSNLPSITQASPVASVPFTEPKLSPDVKSTTERDLEMDQENIESDVSKTEDVKLNSTVQKSAVAVHQDHGHPVRGAGPVLQGQLAAVLAGVFALLAVAAYIGLLTWRRYLEHRYGNREMLINEEDQISYNDMKNFEL